MWASVILGLVVFLASAAGLIARPAQERWEYWLIGLAALIAFAAPFALGYNDHAEPLWTALILGAALLLLDAFELFRGAEAGRAAALSSTAHLMSLVLLPGGPPAG